MRKLILTDSFLEKYKNIQPNWGFGDLSLLVFKRTYSREKESGELEEWWETIRRVVEGVYSAQITHCDRNDLPFNMNKGQRSAQIMYDLMFNMKFLPPGRGLEHMGAKSLYVKGGAVLNNCSFISTEDIKTDFSRPFAFLMDLSALGVGVASDTRGAGKISIKGAQPNDSLIFQIPDSREGWVESLVLLLNACAYGTELPKFDYSLLRPEGAPLKTFGGQSSGPEPLKHMHKHIAKILNDLAGKPITSVAIVDIFNHIGKCIVAGGTRRTAELMLGSAQDVDFLNMKDPKQFKNELKSHRWASNNSCIAELGMDYSPFVDMFARNGEPGFFWMDNARHYGRIKDGYGDWENANILGTNPCSEQTLDGEGEVCCLVEVFPARHESLADIQNTLKFAYLYAKTVTLIPTHDKHINAIVGRNRRIGTSVTGVTQAIEKFGFRNFMSTLDKSYKYVRQLDGVYSRWLCVPTSIKVTTVKPSGTVSLLAGATPGMHYPHSEYYIRNVRLQRTSNLIPQLKKAGYKCEDSVCGDNTVVVSFPVHSQNFLRAKKDVSAIEQLELAASLQYYWSDNQVSATISIRPEEIETLKHALPIYESRLKSVSFLPADDTVYEQAPYIEQTKEQYEASVSKIKPLDLSTFRNHEVSDKYCDGGRCELPSS